MDRRQFISAMTGAAALLSVAQSGRAECGEELYHKQARLQAATTPLGEEDFYALFAGELRQLMRAPRRYPRNEPIGPLLNAFFGWGILPGTEVKVGKVTRVSGSDGGPSTISVEVNYRGERHQILVLAVRENEVWRIANISYDSGKRLVDHYRAITQP